MGMATSMATGKDAGMAWHDTITGTSSVASTVPVARSEGTVLPPAKRPHNAQGKRKPGPPRALMTTEQQQQSVTLAAAGWSQERIAKATGRSRNSIKRHLDDREVMDMVRDERTEMVELYRDRARACALAITDEKIQKSSALQLATASGILLDKGLLLSGQPTSINVVALMEVCDLLRQQGQRESEQRQQQATIVRG